jgi:hypothetical protein
MRQPYRTITPDDLGDHPELAALEILDSALDTTKVAVIAVHPELTDMDPDALPLDLERFAAEQVLIAADLLQRAIATYRAVSTTGAYWSRRSSPDLADTPF